LLGDRPIQLTIAVILGIAAWALYFPR